MAAVKVLQGIGWGSVIWRVERDCRIWFQALLQVVGRIPFFTRCWTKGLSPSLTVGWKPPSGLWHIDLSTGQLITWKLTSLKTSDWQTGHSRWKPVFLLSSLGCALPLLLPYYIFLKWVTRFSPHSSGEDCKWTKIPGGADNWGHLRRSCLPQAPFSSHSLPSP